MFLLPQLGKRPVHIIRHDSIIKCGRAVAAIWLLAWMRCRRQVDADLQTAFQAVMQCSLEEIAAKTHLLRRDEQDDSIVR